MPTTKSSEGIVKSDDIFADRIFATTELDNILTKGKGGAVLTTKRYYQFCDCAKLIII